MMDKFKRPDTSRASYLNDRKLNHMKYEAARGRSQSEWIILLVDEVRDLRAILAACETETSGNLRGTIKAALGKD